MGASFLKKVDWWIVSAVAVLCAFSLFTLHSFSQTGVDLMGRQMLWVGISFALFFLVSSLDLSFLRQSKVVMVLYGVGIALLVALIFVGATAKGATSWFNFGGFSFQPSDLVKIILIIILAKYLSRRHVEIRAMKHIFITGIYFIIPFVLILMQPDFGSAIIFPFIWFGMMLVSGISKKHLLTLSVIGLVAFGGLWGFVFQDYQKNRIVSFMHPLSDIQGTGYNAYQSTIAVGSGQLLGKGIGYGTQSRLHFLPEYETDFIFAAFSEEWGFVGSILVLLLFLLIIFRILYLSYFMESNFELLFGVGLALYLIAHIFVNIGMNIGLLPVTGVTLPFLSAGGSHLLAEFIGLGMFMAMRPRSERLVRESQKPTVLLDGIS